MTAIHNWLRGVIQGIVRRAELMIWGVVCLFDESGCSSSLGIGSGRAQRVRARCLDYSATESM